MTDPIIENSKTTNIDLIKSELRSYIRERYRVTENDPDFTDEVHLYDYGYVDSFGAVDLKAFLESKFSVNFTQSDLTTFPLNTVQQMATFVFKRKKGEI